MVIRFQGGATSAKGKMELEGEREEDSVINCDGIVPFESLRIPRDLTRRIRRQTLHSHTVESPRRRRRHRLRPRLASKPVRSSFGTIIAFASQSRPDTPRHWIKASTSNHLRQQTRSTSESMDGDEGMETR